MNHSNDIKAARNAEFLTALEYNAQRHLDPVVGSTRQIRYATVLRMKALPLIDEAMDLLSASHARADAKRHPSPIEIAT